VPLPAPPEPAPALLVPLLLAPPLLVLPALPMLPALLVPALLPRLPLAASELQVVHGTNCAEPPGLDDEQATAPREATAKENEINLIESEA